LTEDAAPNVSSEGVAPRAKENLVAPNSDGAHRPIIALAFWIGGTVEYFALAASCRFRSSGEKTATATGLTRIQRLFGVVVQLALPVLGLAKGAGIGADEILPVFSVRK
jgi:hypothetical protein